MRTALLSKNIGSLVTRAQMPPPDTAAPADMPEEAPAEAPAETDVPGGTPSLEDVEREQMELPFREQKPMPMPKVERVRNWNMTIVAIGGLTMYFSYQTMVAFDAPDSGRVVRKNDWGPTTGTHLNYIDGGAVNTRLSSDEFTKRWSEASSKFMEIK